MSDSATRSLHPKEDAAASDRPQVIFVHGTFASSEEDSGTAWWQIGSDFWLAMEADLAGHAELVSDRTVFRWADDSNTESARHRAASQLLKYLQDFESRCVPYYLVGHSHGGSVIWEALKKSLSSGYNPLSRGAGELTHLLSWTTIGTPFIRMDLRKARWLLSGAMTLLALVALTIAFAIWIATDIEDLQWVEDLALPAVVCWLVYAILSSFVIAYDDGRRIRS